MSEEELLALKNGTYKLPEEYSYEIQKQEDEYGHWVEAYKTDIDDVIADPYYYRIVVVIHQM